MKKIKVFLGLPIYGEVSPLFMNEMLRLMAAPPCEIEMGQELGNPVIASARNSLTARFLASDCTHLLFLDSDMLPTAEHFKTLMSREVAIVGAMCPKKKDGEVEWALCARDGGGTSNIEHRTSNFEQGTVGLLRVKYIGAGMVLIDRQVFEAMIHRFGEEMVYEAGSSRNVHGPEHNFWSEGIYPRRLNGKWTWLGEDWAFCQRANDCGFDVWADTKVVVPHIGRAIYPMQHQREALQRSGVFSLKARVAGG